MTSVIITAPGWLTKPQRQHRLCLVECSDLRLLIDAEHDSVLRRRDVEPNNIAHLGDEIRIRPQLEGLQPVRLQTKARQMRCTLDTDSPLACAMLRELQWVAFSSRLSSMRTITASIRASSMDRGALERGPSEQAINPLLKEPLALLAHRRRMNLQPHGDTGTRSSQHSRAMPPPRPMPPRNYHSEDQHGGAALCCPGYVLAEGTVQR